MTTNAQAVIEFEEAPIPPIPVLGFLNWDKPLLPRLVKWLLNLSENEGRGFGELSHKIIVVPTRQSGRKLRQSLAENGCVLAPRVVTPEFFLQQEQGGGELARLWAWVDVLQDLDLEDARNLFPKDPPDGVEKSFGWALNVGRELRKVEQDLSRVGKDFNEVSRRSSGGMDAERWVDLAMLQDRVERELTSWGLSDLLQDNELVEVDPASDIIVAGICDLSSVVINRFSELLATEQKINVIVHAPVERAHDFDSWGRPVSPVWSEENIAYEGWQEKVSLCEKPDLLADKVVHDIAANKWAAEDVNVGLCDSDLTMSVQRSFDNAGWAVYDPEGTNVQSSSLLQFLTELKSWLSDNRPIAALQQILRLPESEGFLPPEVDRLKVVKELDAWVAQTMMTSTYDLSSYLKAKSPGGRLDHRSSLATIQHWIEETKKLNQGSSVRGLKGWIAKALNRTEETVASRLVDEMADIFTILEQIEQGRRGVNSNDLTRLLEILIIVLSERKVYGDVEGTVLDLLGWMELVYEDAEHLLLLGLHEGVIPAAGGDDRFLPDGFRDLLGLETGNVRYARDSYLLQSFLHSRADVRVFLTKLNEANEPNQVSRLLLRASGPELAARVKKFFGESEIVPENPGAWQRDWTLKLPEEVPNPYAFDLEEKRMLSPTALKEYLKCPLRFYFKRVVGMKRCETNKTEMNAMEFGNMVHAVVERFGMDEDVRQSISAKEIEAFFDAELDREAFFRFGAKPSLALQIQIDIARSRLRTLSRHQAEQRRAGWRIQDVELKVATELKWEINGHPMTMMIDRVDRHEKTGELRIWDYKTSATAMPPYKTHLTKYKEAENRAQLGELINFFEKVAGGRNRGREHKEQRWCDLQLPIYAWFAQNYYNYDGIPGVGYIQLPSALMDTSFSLWHGFDSELLESAQEWTTEAISRIEKSEFFNPAELPNWEKKFDDFDKLAQGDIAEAFGLVSVE